ncbi:MAG: flagellar M-ring protein FliF [Selenomonadaceae bacterium]|nr:flagellar M-ring protein FliF [Selenomonadaceae bacterium]MBQ7723449.1 flagellar M-ring protein FliF [Selenomonadaceae bacterium]
MANWRERLRELWNRYESKRKYFIIGGILVLVLAFAGISYWYGSKPEYAPLYTNLETKDAGDVVNSLKEAGVPYELIEDKKGATILVPLTQVHDLRLELATAGLPRGNKGFELFDDSKLGVTEFQNKINYLQALQGELTRTIEHLGSVDKARVHIVLPEDSLYKKNEKPATASILLMLKPETKLTTPEVKGIVNLVSHSVQGLAPENITIIDEQGNILNKNDDDELEKQNAMTLRTLNQIEMTKKVRDHIQQNIQTMLDKTLGEGNAFVRVSVELDFDDRKIDRQTFTPVVDESGIIRSQQDISESYNGESNMPGGPAGVQSNIPGYVAEDRNANAEYERKESTKNYEVNEENQKIIASPGSIRRLTVAVLVTDEITELQQEGLLRAVSSAAGINEERGDTISVEPMPFNTDLQDKLAEEARLEQLRKDRILYTEIAAMILLAALLVGGFLMYRWKKRKERQAEMEAQLEAERKAREEEEKARLAEEAEQKRIEAEQRLVELQEAQAKAEARAQAIEDNEIEDDNLTEEERRQRDEKQAILKLIDEKPAEVAMLIKTWLIEDE